MCNFLPKTSGIEKYVFLLKTSKNDRCKHCIEVIHYFLIVMKPVTLQVHSGLFQKLEAPPRRQTYFQLKIWEFPGSNFDLKKMGILKIVLKNGNSPIFYVKNSKKLGIQIFFTKNDWIFWEFPCFLYPCNQKSAYFLGFPNEKCG